MPRTTWIKGRGPEPIKQDYIGMMLSEYMRQRKVTYTMLSKKIGKPVSSLQSKRHRGGSKFRLDELFEWGKALDIPGDVIADAIVRMYGEI